MYMSHKVSPAIFAEGEKMTRVKLVRNSYTIHLVFGPAIRIYYQNKVRDFLKS